MATLELACACSHCHKAHHKLCQKRCANWEQRVLRSALKVRDVVLDFVCIWCSWPVWGRKPPESKADARKHMQKQHYTLFCSTDCALIKPPEQQGALKGAEIDAFG